MKTQEELNALKEEVEIVSKKLQELTEEELAQVIGGVASTDDTSVSPSVTPGEHAFEPDAAPIDVGFHE